MKVRLIAWAKRKWLYILAVLMGVALTPSAMNAAYQFRGYRAVGSEYLIIPLFVLFAALLDGVKSTVKEMKQFDKDPNGCLEGSEGICGAPDED